jgi:hypothetical protein
VVERISIGYIIDNNDTVTTAVIRSGNRSKTFLSGGIPNLHFNCLAIDFQRFDFEINAYR